MRSFFPMLGNPWPHDMVVTIDDDPDTLVELLWVRERWNLHPVDDDLPPFLSDESVRAHAQTETPNATTIWRDAWPAVWNSCIHHAGLVDDSTIFDLIRETPDGSPERADLLARLVGPSWSRTVSDNVSTEEYEPWKLVQVQARAHRRPISVAESPERMSLSELIPAWRAGLEKIVTIPCQGSYTRIIGEHTLLVTDQTRDDHQQYSEALRLFR